MIRSRRRDWLRGADEARAAHDGEASPGVVMGAALANDVGSLGVAPWGFRLVTIVPVPDRYVIDADRKAIPADEKVIPAGPVPGDPKRYVWLTFTRYARIVGASVRVGQMECCGCHRMVPASDLWSVMPVDEKSIICGAGYLYCGVCRLGESPEHAYAHADAAWKQNRNRKPRGKPEVQLGKQVRI